MYSCPRLYVRKSFLIYSRVGSCRSEATLAVSAFYLRKEKDDEKKILEDKDLEVLGAPVIKYGDSTVIVQHVETGLWLSYKVFTFSIVSIWIAKSGNETNFKLL